MNLGKFSLLVLAIALLVTCAGSEGESERDDLLSCDRLASRFGRSGSTDITTRDCFEATYPGGYTAEEFAMFKAECNAPVTDDGSQGASSQLCPSDGPFGLACACAVNLRVVYFYEVVIDGVLDTESTASTVLVCESTCRVAKGTLYSNGTRP
jgi:hypothetical protein